jgi:hypothetical protein
VDSLWLSAGKILGVYFGVDFFDLGYHSFSDDLVAFRCEVETVTGVSGVGVVLT